MRNFFRKFMVGRYGPDHLCIAMIVFSFALSLLHAIIGYTPLLVLSYAAFGLTLFRMLSRNVYRRRAENDKFIKYWWPIWIKMKRCTKRAKQLRTHKVTKCPKCGAKLRVPRGIGKLRITCSKCGEKLFMKS